MLEELEFQQHRDIRPDREMTECQRPAEVRVRLIGGADEEQKEEPAAIASGQVDREDEEEHVDAEEHGAEVEPRLQRVERKVEGRPRHEAVGRANGSDQPRAHLVGRRGIPHEPVAQQERAA